MTWIEDLLHISPDGGNGTVEFAFFLVVLTVIGAVAMRYFRSTDGRSRKKIRSD
jgi:hypothetical protein